MVAILLKFGPAKFVTLRLINHEYHYAFRAGSRVGLDLIPYAFQDFVLDVLPSQGHSEYRELDHVLFKGFPYAFHDFCTGHAS